MTRYGPLSLCNLFALAVLLSATVPVLGEPAEHPDPGSVPGWEHDALWRDWGGHLGMGLIGAFAMTLVVIIIAALIISFLRALTHLDR